MKRKKRLPRRVLSTWTRWGVQFRAFFREQFGEVWNGEIQIEYSVGREICWISRKIWSHRNAMDQTAKGQHTTEYLVNLGIKFRNEFFFNISHDIPTVRRMTRCPPKWTPSVKFGWVLNSWFKNRFTRKIEKSSQHQAPPGHALRHWLTEPVVTSQWTTVR